MIRNNKLIALVMLAIFSFPAMADVRDTPTERAFSLSSESPALVVQRGTWVIARELRTAMEPIVYYMLTSGSGEMILSVRIDKTSWCQSAEDCLAATLKKKTYKDAIDQKLFKTGSFKAAQFYLEEPEGSSLKQAHLLAAAYVDGHWFDVHISKSGPSRPELNQLSELLRSLSIR
jgi:hypothetical protein